MPNKRCKGWAIAAVLVAVLLPVPVAGNAAAPRSKARPAASAPAVLPPGNAIPRVAPLLLAEVLASSRFHAPQILEALARLRGAEGKRISADAAFDTLFSASADTRLSGFYDGRDLTALVTKPLGDLGGFAYGGYRVSGGTFPTYEDERFTSQFGELKAGAVFALLRDRRIDERRFGRIEADAEIAQAQADQLIIAIGVQVRAIQAYNNWLLAGLRLRVYQDLLALALDRQAGFRRQVTTGAQPEILLTENEQNILRRRALVVQSEQALAVGATALSLFLRDADGLPTLPDTARLPAEILPLRTPANAAVIGVALAARFDLRIIDIRLRLASQQLALDRNALQPKLDLQLETSNDFGPLGAGGSSRRGFESKVGINFSLPLQQSAARGRLAQTRAEIDAFQQRRRLLEDQIRVDIAALGIAVEKTGELARLAVDEANLANTMANAERRRFTLGASDFFVVNVREEAAADAQVRRLDAAFRQIVANADLAATTADLDTLGL
jgi:outer membrane protein TolC